MPLFLVCGMGNLCKGGVCQRKVEEVSGTFRAQCERGPLIRRVSRMEIRTNICSVDNGEKIVLGRDILLLLMADLGPLHRSWPRKFPSLPGCSLKERLITSLAPLYSSVNTTAQTDLGSECTFSICRCLISIPKLIAFS